MKKFIKILLFVILLIPVSIKASDYGIENYYINTTIKKNGDLQVEEYFIMNGSFNGMERIINFKNNSAYNFNPDAPSYGGNSLHNGDSMEIKEVRALDIDSKFNFKNIKGKKFTLVSYANKGDYGVYTSHDNYSRDGKTIKIFLPSKKKKAFYIKYVLHNMAILHNDIGELGWNVFGNNLSESIYNLVVYVNIPDNKDDLRVWGHGPLNGGSKIISKEQAMFNINHLNSYTAIDVRLTFDKDVINNSTKKSNVDALDKVVKYEEDQAEQANEIRRQSDERYIGYINSNLEYLEKHPTRTNYDETEEYILYLNDSSKRKEYLNKLITYQDKVDEYEYDLFKYYLSSKPTYDNYIRLQEIKEKLFSEEIKKKAEKDLKVYYKKLVKQEIKTEAILTLISGITLLISVSIYYKNKIFKNIKKRTNPLYYRDIPSDLNPASVGLLVDKEINKDEISACIIDMVRRKIITVTKQENNSCDFTLNTPHNELNELDQTVSKMIFGDTKTTKINSKKIKKVSHYKFETFKTKVVKELEDNKLIEEYKIKVNDEVKLGFLHAGIVFLVTPLFPLSIIFISIYAYQRYRKYFIIWLFIFLNIILMIISLSLNHIVHFLLIPCIVTIVVIKILLKKYPRKEKIKYKEEGKKEKNNWNALRNFLIDFSLIKEKDIPEIELWEKYLVYATALGVGKKVLDNIRIKIQQEKLDIDLDSYVILNNIDTMNHIYHSVGSLSDKVMTVSLPKIDYNSGIFSGSSGGGYSSGSGGGGGFSGGSSGGGSFGGGGGGGRF